MQIRWAALPVLVLPLYSITTALQACASDSTSPGASSNQSSTPNPTSPGDAAPLGQLGTLLSCQVDETAKKVGTTDVCCTSADNAFTCRTANEASPGSGCPTLGATALGKTITATFDVCIVETCTNDRDCTEYANRSDEYTGTLRCTASPDSPGQQLWTWEGDVIRHHEVTACLGTEARYCDGKGGTIGSLDFPGYAAGSGEPIACEAPPSEYPFKPISVTVRKLFVLQSICKNGDLPVECPPSSP